MAASSASTATSWLDHAPGIQELMSTVAAQGVKPTGPWFSRHFKIDASSWDFEISIPVDTVVKPQGRVKPSELSSRKVARAIYRGPYEGLGAAWQDASAPQLGSP